MALDTKLNLNNNNVEQLLSDELNLSGDTTFHGTINSINGYQIAGTGTTITVYGGNLTFNDNINGVQSLSGLSAGKNVLFTLALACSDVSTDLEVGVNKAVFFMPFNMKLTEIFAALGTVCSGSTFITEVNLNDVSILSGATKISIDSNENTSLTASSPTVILTSSLPKGGKISVDFDQVGVLSTGNAHTLYFRGTIY